MNTRIFFLIAALLLGHSAFAQTNNQSQALAERLERFPQADTNKDGELSLEEWNVFDTRRQAEREARQAAKPKPTHANVPYGDHERQVFDIWITPSDEATPLVIYIHGGGFRSGNKNSINGNSLKAFQDAGLSVAAIHYRLSDVGPYPIYMEDAARCLQTIRHRADEWNINPEKIACYGGSAGAGISLWLGFHDDLADPSSADPIARQSTRIVAAATSNGQSTYDLRHYRKWFNLGDFIIHEAFFPMFEIEKGSDFWSDKRILQLMKDSSSISHLTKDDVPVFMTYGRGNVPVDNDTNPGVWVHHVLLGLKLQEAMEKLGLECTVVSPEHPESRYGSMEAFLIAKLTD